MQNKDNKTLAECGEKAGYLSIAKGGRQIYRPSTKKHIAEKLANAGISKDSVREFFQAIADLAIKNNDLSNANRAGENIARMYNHLKDVERQHVTAIFANIDKEIQDIIQPKQTIDT